MEFDLLNYSEKKSEFKIFIDDSLKEISHDTFSFINDEIEYVDLQHLNIKKGSFLIIAENKVGNKFKKADDYFSVVFKQSEQNISFREGEELFYLSTDGHEYNDLLSLYSYFKNEELVSKLTFNAHKKALEIYKETAHYLSGDSYSTLHNNAYKIFFKIRSSINSSISLSELMVHISDAFIDLEQFQDIKVIKSLELSYEDFIYDQGNELVSLEWIEEDLFLSYKKTTDSESLFISFCLVLIIELIDKLFLLNEVTPSTLRKKNIWEGAIEAIPFPLALVSESGDIVIYNSKFTGLNIPPRECLKLVGQEVIQVGSNYYDLSVSRLETREGICQLFIFQDGEAINSDDRLGDVKTVSSTELGIISSSIAHELNNPLAGILAAISLLELEDWDEESASMLLDMKSSAGRCKGLVEIFLSFSKSGMRPNGTGRFRDCVTQSIDLLRFRMIESGVRLKVEIKNTDEVFKDGVNVSLCTMIFYLLLGEVLTDFNHDQIVTGEKNSMIEASFTEHSDNVSLRFTHKLRLKTFLEESKLINYLVAVQGLNLEVVHNGFIVKSWSLV